MKSALAASLLTACASFGASPAAPPAHTTAAATNAQNDSAEGPVWRAVAPRGIPMPMTAVGALRGGVSIVIAAGGLYRWDATGATSVCPDARVSSVASEGDRLVALEGGALRGERVHVWFSSDQGAHCGVAELPDDFAPTASRPIQIALFGHGAVVWDAQRNVARSDDGGATWRMLPELAGVWSAIAGPGEYTTALVELDPRGERLRRHVLGPPPSTAWIVPPGGPELRGPVAARTGGDGGMILADATGTVSIDAAGTIVERVFEPAFHDPLAQPRALAAGGPGLFVGLARRSLFALSDRGFRPFAEAPGDAAALAASTDGTVWLAAHNELYRSESGGALSELIDRPLGRAEPRGIASAGNALALFSFGDVIARSRDGGEHWTRERLPAELGGMAAATISTDGSLLALGAGGLVAEDNGPFVRLTLPVHPPAPPGAAPAVAAFGSRWIVVDGGVFTSDDQGQRWTERWDPRGEGAGGAVAAAFHEASVMLLDASRQLWRSDDAGATFTAVGSIQAMARFGEPRAAMQTVVWDGGARIAIVARRILVSRDDGEHWEAMVVPGVARGARFLPDGRLLLQTTGGGYGCASQPGDVLQLPSVDGSRFVPIADACAHPVVSFDVDGTTVWTLSPAGVVSRAEANRIVLAAPRTF